MCRGVRLHEGGPAARPLRARRSQSIHSLNELVVKLTRDSSALRIPEANVLLVRTVEIASASLEQTEAISEAIHLLNGRRVVVAVNHFDAR